MEEGTLLERFQRECPLTYAQLYANVDFFRESHALPIDVAKVFAEDWVHHWEQLAIHGKNPRSHTTVHTLTDIHAGIAPTVSLPPFRKLRNKYTEMSLAMQVNCVHTE
jgi:hypothetical protein